MHTPLRAAPGPDVEPSAEQPRRNWTLFPLADAPRPQHTGLILADRFELRAPLGEGGMASLYIASDRQLRCKVAVKILRDDSPDLRQRFLREAEILSNVRHEHLIHTIARGFTPEGLPFMVLPFLSGQDLEARLRDGALPWATVVEIGIQLADALRCMHAAGVIHRDVKPENIMWTEHGSRSVFVVLIDLGAAKTSPQFQGQQDRTYTPLRGRRETTMGEALGTPAYMPPEAGLRAPDPRTDVFGLGVTLYQLCTGKLPYAADPLTPTPMRISNPTCEVPPDLERVIMDALQWERDERTPDMATLHEALLAVRSVYSAEGPGRGLFAGRLELREHLATGAEAEVFRAYHRTLGRPVALKRLLAHLQKNPDDCARFEREARVLASLHHVGLPQIHDSGAADGRLFTVMELCKGKPARWFCDDANRLTLAEVLLVALQAAQALQAVHEIGVIHRDLSAQNILIETGRAPLVKVIDFTGCLLTARFYALRDEPDPATDPGATVPRDRPLHNLPFAAPEVRNLQRWSEGSDIYALGVLLYRLLTGKVPYTTQDRERYIPLHIHAPELPASVDQLLAAMLHPDPEQRLSHMSEVAERVRDILADETGYDETEPAPRPRTWPGARRKSDAVAAHAPEPSPAAPVTIPATSAAPRRRGLLLVGALALGLVALLWTLRAPQPQIPASPDPLASTNIVETPTLEISPPPPPAPIPAPIPEPAAPTEPIPAAPATPAIPPTAAKPPPPLTQKQLEARLRSSPVAECSTEWLTLKLHVADGHAALRRINGVTPRVRPGPTQDPVHACVRDALTDLRLPDTAPTTLTAVLGPR